MYVRMGLMRCALRIVPGLLLIVALTAGCSRRKIEVYGTPNKNPARSIVSLSPSSTEVVALKGGTNFLSGRTAYCNYPTFVKKVPIVGSVKPDYEKIAEVKPDLIVYDPDLYSASEVAQMKNYSRLEPFALGGDTIAEFEDNLYKLAQTYTGETFMSEYVDQVETAKRASLADPVTPAPKVALLLPGEKSEHMIAGTKSFQADEIRCATGQPVGPDDRKFVKLNAESLIQMNPDIILVAGDPSPILDDPRLKSLTAVKKNRVRGVLADAILRRGVRVPEVITQLHGTFSELMAS